MQRNSRGLFLDLDGTLADSLTVLRRVYFRFLEKFGFAGSDAEFDRLNGPKLNEVVTRLDTFYQLPGTIEDLAISYNQLIDDAYAQVSPSKGAGELLGTATEKGWIITLVTSNSGARARAWLSQVGFADWVDFLVSGEEVERGKPWPDLYQLALSRTTCAVANSVAVEDSPKGAKAALAAGLRTFALATKRVPSVAWPNKVQFIEQLDDLLVWL
jgi:HAD superfamily hydrolase (TIGR01509 family)